MSPSLARLACRAQVGLDAPLVQVEVTLAGGLPVFYIVGLPATVVKESRERVRAALQSCGFDFPAGRIVVNLAPAEIPKDGGRFELPMALGILIASGQLPGAPRPDSPPCELYGELGLGGELRPVRGILLAAAHAGRAGHELIVPAANLREAVMAGAPVRCAAHLREVCGHWSGGATLPLQGRARGVAASNDATSGPDLCDVRGQLQAKRAVLIAAAGAHSLLLIGPPGSGKTLLARRLAPLLPPLTEAEALECAAIASVSAGGFDLRGYGRRPFREPHHSASVAALVGGGARALPGEVSLAHHGVLFLDELPEFDRRVLEALREPLEAGTVSVSRAAAHAVYPAQFQLIAAMNPCPCGHDGDEQLPCRCTPAQIARYRGRLSGPLLERLDMQVAICRPAALELDPGAPRGEDSAALAARVTCARARQMARQGRCNAHLDDAQVERWCRPDPAGARLLAQAIERLHLSPRVRQRILKLARTIADLDRTADTLTAAHVGEAVMLRCLDRERATAVYP